MSNIIPAILPMSQGELVTRAEQVLGLANTVQIDVCDGIFVESKTDFDELPFRDKLSYELDLMISVAAAVQLDSYIAMRPGGIVLHIESIAENPTMYIDQVKAAGIKVGLALSNSTPNKDIEPYLDRVDFVQCMGIAQCGYQGMPFDEMVLEKMAELRKAHPDLVISVDGGVSRYTIKQLRAAGANRYIVGSAVFSPAPIDEFHEPTTVAENIEKLESLIQ